MTRTAYLKSSPGVDILLSKMFGRNKAPRERRRQERREFPHYLQFKNDQTGELVGDLADISHKGFRLECMRLLQPHSDVRFRVDMPPGINGRASIVFVAQSRWVRPHPVDPRMYVAGYEIRQIDPVDSRAFQEVFTTYGASGKVKDRMHDYVWQD